MSRRTSERAPLLGDDADEGTSSTRCSSVKTVVWIFVILVVVTVITLLSLQLAVTWNKLGNIENEIIDHKTTTHQPLTTTTATTTTTSATTAITSATTTVTTAPTTVTTATTTTLSPWNHPQIKDCSYKTSYIIKELRTDNVIVVRERNGSLLLGSNYATTSTLLVYDITGFKTLSKIQLSSPFFDAMWTPEGNILYTLPGSRRVVLVMENGTVKRETRMLAPRYLTLAENGRDIFLADRDGGAFKSSDGGVTWVNVYQPDDGWECWKFFAVSNGDNVYWSYEILSETSGSNIYRLVMSVDGGVSWREFSIPSDVSMQLSINANTIMTYDWNGNFLLAGAGSSASQPLHIFSYEGHYVGKLQMTATIITLYSVNVKQQKVLNGTAGVGEFYVGDKNGRVHMFALNYYNA